MMKYLIGLGALIVIVVGYLLLAPAGSPPTAALEPVTDAVPSEPAPANTPVAPEAIVLDEITPVSPDEDAVLEEMAADARESLPKAVTDTLTLTDALFLPRMRIMEFSYVTAASDARAEANNMRALIEARTETVCLEGRQMFEMGVTLRNSFEDGEGNVFQRVYLLPEDCLRYY